MSVEVQTTQNVTIDYEPAGLGYRILAYLIDWLIIGCWILGIKGIINILDFLHIINQSTLDLESFNIILYIIIFFPILFYDLLFETLNHGQSPGKMLFKIRAVNLDGTTPSFGAYLLRWLFKLVDIWLSNSMVAIVSIIATKNGQRVGDLVAKTTVIDLKMNAKFKIPELNFRNDYKVTYYDILDKLSDRDIQTIRSMVEDNKMKNSEYFIPKLTQKIKLITGYTYEGADILFLYKIISDYDYLALQY